MTTIANGSSAREKKVLLSNKAKETATVIETTSTDRTTEIVKLGGGKPDLNHHHLQLDLIKAEIEKVNSELDNVKGQLSGSAPANTPEGKRRTELNAELESIRQSQAGNKGARGKILDEVRAVHDSLNAKVKALQTTRSKSTYKSPADIDSAIARLNAQVDSGNLKLVEEKKALNEISTLRKSRKAVEGFTKQQDEIDLEREKLEKLRSQLDDPQSRKMSQRFDEIRTELDAIKAKTEKSGTSRQQLMDKRIELQAKLDTLWNSRRTRQAEFRSENDSYSAKIRVEREKRNEKYKEEKAAEEQRRRQEEEVSMREEAALPAYGKEIEDCEVLIRFFALKSSGVPTDEIVDDSISKKDLEGVKRLELRKIESDDTFAGATIAKKKSQQEEDDGYFVGGSKKGKGKKKGKGMPLSLTDEKSNGNGGSVDFASTTTRETPLNIPLPMLSLLLTLNIPPPTSASDVSRVVGNLRLKKAYYVDDQERKTKENIDALEKKLKVLHVKEEAKKQPEEGVATEE